MMVSCLGVECLSDSRTDFKDESRDIERLPFFQRITNYFKSKSGGKVASNDSGGLVGRIRSLLEDVFKKPASQEEPVKKKNTS